MEQEPILEVHGVSKTYPGFALREVSFTLPRGYIMGLIGPNGAGKTTLVKMILGLVRPEGGWIRVFGLDPERDGAAVRARIGFVHENPAFYEGLSAERAAAAIGPFYPTWDGAAFRRLAKEFGLPLEKKLKTFSRGMRTRFALALALSHEAELLLLDEPTAGLDPAFRRELLDRLQGVIEGGETSVLFSTHITSDLDRTADYVTFLREGHRCFSLTKEEVLERYALVKGDPKILDEDTRRLFRGLVVTEFGFTGLTDDVETLTTALEGRTFVVDRATLEDVVFYTGRTGMGGIRFHGQAG